MKKVVPGAAVLVLSLALVGCSTAEPTATDRSQAPTTSEAPTAAPTTGGGAAHATTPAPSDAAPAPTSMATADQSTPEAAMTAWLTALLHGDSATVCGLMAANGTAIADLPSAREQCAKAITPMLEQLKSAKDMFKGLKVTGATVQGDSATFDKATTTPELAATIIKNLKAVKLKGKWYVTQR